VSPARSPSERGDTLVELLTTIGLMSLAIVFIIGGIGEAAMLSGVHRNQADTSASLTSAAEYLSGQKYVACSSAASPSAAAAFNGLLAGWAPTALDQHDVTVPTVVKVTDTSGNDCTGLATDPGLEMVWLQASSNNTKVTQTLYLVKGNR